jgi:outer membrane protein OmpA-like peptidoglycan-associated protein
MRRSTGAFRSVLTAVLLWAGGAMAQDQEEPQGVPRFNLERLRLNPSTMGGFSVGTGELLPPGTWKVSLAAHYEHRPLTLDFPTRNRFENVVSDRETLHLMGAYAFTGWLQGLELDVAVPLVLQQGQALRDHKVDEFGGVGTILVAPRWGLLSRQRSPIDLAVQLAVDIPVGSMNGLTRDADVRYLPSVMAGYSLGGLRLGMELGVLSRSELTLSRTASPVTDALGPELLFGGTVMQTGRRLRWQLEAWARQPILDKPSPRSGEVLFGGRYLLATFMEIYGLFGLGIGQAPGTPAFRVIVGGSFGTVVPPHVPPEALVLCDGLPHSLQDCPDFDDDGDGVRNSVDLCPLEPGRPEFYGCARQPDSDGDGVLDRDDECPDVPGPPSNRGCPIPDVDGDGIRDEKDLCPDRPGPAKFEGCPDTDGDDIPDNLDACPKQKGRAELQGCMPPDLDEDGVPNSLDSCINDPGKSDEDHAGCPIPPLVTIGVEDSPVGGSGAQAGPRRKVLKLRGKVFFKTSVSELDPRSFELLDSVAKVLQEHPELKVVEIGAHTDARGTEQEQRRLTELRADTVRRYLVDKGVDAKRLSAKGYGHDKWVASDATAQGREANRRVEFIVTSEEQTSREDAPQ